MPSGKLAELLNVSLISIVLVEDSAYMDTFQISRDVESDIPYLEHNAPLDPTKSRLIGVALIRGISKRRQCLQILSPLPAAVLSKDALPPERTLLVHGCFEMPKALLLEQSHYDSFMDTTRTRQGPAPFIEVDAGEDVNKKEGEARWRSRRFNMGGA